MVDFGYVADLKVFIGTFHHASDMVPKGSAHHCGILDGVQVDLESSSSCIIGGVVAERLHPCDVIWCP